MSIILKLCRLRQSDTPQYPLYAGIDSFALWAGIRNLRHAASLWTQSLIGAETRERSSLNECR